MSVRYAKTGLYRLHKPWLFLSGRARFSSKKYRNSFGKTPPPFHMQVAIQSNHLHLMCWRCLRPNRSIGYLISLASPRSRHRLRQSWLMFAVPQVTKTALNMARIYEAKYQSRFQCTCYLKTNGKQAGPQFKSETSHPPLFRNLFMHSRPSNT